ncbi:hypothetical protein AB1Y20_023187 [Prymnesium parvum]|uniref:Dienelactone hydrolase domain-containing protein n=1 Tax=Prymnesium parvum TaxID=97485 RepID=A0AB34JEQ7_PRYPA
MAQLSLLQVDAGSNARVPVHLSRPSTRPTAAVILCHHGLGIYQDDFQRRYADSLAQLGFLVALPDFYHRTWPVTKVASTKGAGLSQKDLPVVDLITRVSDEQLVADATAVVEYLEAKEGITSIGVAGFCLGGRTAWLLACAMPDKIKACNMCHGGNITIPLQGTRLCFCKLMLAHIFGRGAVCCPHGKARSPLDRCSALRCPVMAHVGAADNNPSPAEAELLRASLAKCGNSDMVVHVYDGAKHGFCCGDSDSYQQAAADLAWQRTASFLLKALTPGKKCDIPAAPGKSKQTGAECTSACAEIAKKDAAVRST